MADDWGDDAGGDDWGDDDNGGGDDGWGEDEAGGADDGWGGDDTAMAGGAQEEELTPELKIENAFYEADDTRLENPTEALKQFKTVVKLASEVDDMRDETRTFVFKALRNIVSLNYQAANLAAMMSSYKDLLEFIPQVTRNEGQEAVSSVLLEVNECKDLDFVQQAYDATLETLAKMADQDRLWFRVTMKYAEFHYSREDFEACEELLKKLERSCQTAEGKDDASNKAAELLEIYALSTRVSMERQDIVGLKVLFEKTKDLTAAVKDPKSQSIIKECWGQMYGDQGAWAKAYKEFFDAFTSYTEIGDQIRAKTCLKYVVVSNMLTEGSTHNPFDAREAKVYQNDPDIAAVEDLRKAAEVMDVPKFNKALERLIKDGDRFINRHLRGIIRDFQGKAIIKMIKSYRRVYLDALGEELHINRTEVEELLIQLILDGRVVGKIDQVKGLLDLTQRGVGGGAKYLAAERWAAALGGLRNTLPNPNFGGSAEMMMGGLM